MYYLIAFTPFIVCSLYSMKKNSSQPRREKKESLNPKKIITWPPDRDKKSSSGKNSSHKSSALTASTEPSEKVPLLGSPNIYQPISFRTLQISFPQLLADRAFKHFLESKPNCRYCVQTNTVNELILLIQLENGEWVTPAYTDSRIMVLSKEWQFFPISPEGKCLFPKAKIDCDDEE